VNIAVDSALWSVDPANVMISDSSGVFFKNLMFFSDSSSFSINGGVSHNRSDTLKLIFNEVNISHLDQLLPGGKVDVDGILNGEASIVNLYRNPNFLINMELKDMAFNGQDFGLLKARTVWKKNLGYLRVDLDVLHKGNIGTSEVLHVDGKYFPTSGVQNFDLNARLTNLNTHIFNPFITEFVDIDRESLASGELKITGSYAKPVVAGKVKLTRTQFLIKYLNVLYSAGGNIVFGENFININDLILYDTRGRSASCTGNIYHDYFRDFNVDIVVNQDDFTALRIGGNIAVCRRQTKFLFVYGSSGQDNRISAVNRHCFF
jgi:autotransporter translocation and assembly factor TamB